MTRKIVIGLLTVSMLAALQGSVTARSDERSLPNLVALWPEVVLGDADEGTGTRAIRIGTHVANRGEAHLDLLGQATASTDRAAAMQCVEWATDRTCSVREEVGEFVWHPEHGHHHFEDFALYELRRLRKNGLPDMRPQGLATQGNKVSFCLIDYQRDEDDSGSEDQFLGWPLYLTCVVGAGQQGISRGWRDVYGPRLEGQQIVIDGVPDGLYALVITVDPKNRLIETKDDDNTVAVRLSLAGDGLEVVCVYDPTLTTCTPGELPTSEP